MSLYSFLLILYKYLLLFFSGTLAGWVLEVFWRRFFGQARRWINPGFLSGPWLPLYGFGVVILYVLSALSLSLPLRALLFLTALTVLEYGAGLIFTRVFNIRLWDYRENRGNIQGLICPLYSFLWMLLGLGFNRFVYPFFRVRIDYLYSNLYLTFFLGIFAGIFAVDLWQSFGIAGRIRSFVHESEERWQVDFEKFKLELRDRVSEGFINRTRYLLPFNGELGHSLREQLKKHRQDRIHPSGKIRRAIEKRKNK